MQVQIREAKTQDAATLARLNFTVQQFHVETMPHRYKFTAPDDPHVIAAFERFLRDENGRIYIAEVDGTPVGYVYSKITHTEENAFVHAYRSLHIDQMSVVEAYQGKGVADILMEHVLRYARELGIDAVTLGVMAFNTRAQRFYQKHGFEFHSSRMIKHIKE